MSKEILTNLKYHLSRITTNHEECEQNQTVKQECLPQCPYQCIFITKDFFYPYMRYFSLLLCIILPLFETVSITTYARHSDTYPPACFRPPFHSTSQYY